LNRKKKILIIDTETAGSLIYPIAYDIGGAVVDRDGKIYHEFHFVIDEIFTDLETMATAYYSRKFKKYIKSIYEQNIKPVPFLEVLRKLDALIEFWDIKTVAAYNLAFDKRAMKNTCELITSNTNWLGIHELEELCIMCAACDILYTATYVKLARERGWVTEKGNIRTNAECGYRFVSGNYDFIEEHMGLPDVKIEAEILTAIFRKRQKFNGAIRGFPFSQVYAREKVRK